MTILNDGDFLYVGRLLKSKGVRLILDAFLERTPNDSTMNIVGDRDFGNSDSLTQLEIQEYVLKSNGSIRFFGYQDDLSKYYAPGVIYVSASRREGLPFSVLEALGNGLTCFLSSVPGHKEFSHLPNVHLFRGAPQLVGLMSAADLSSQSPQDKPSIAKFSKNSVKAEIKGVYRLLFNQ